MNRLSFMLLISLLGAGSPWTAHGQEASTKSLVATNPILETVARVNPDSLSLLIDQLGKLTRNGTRPGGSRTGPQAPATAEEQRLLASNPTFAEAYRRFPDDALIVLRWAIRASHSP